MQRGRHRASTSGPRVLTRVTATAAVAGGVVAGLTTAGSATADKNSSARAAVVAQNETAHTANVEAATAPLKLRPVVPAKSINLAATQETRVKKAATSTRQVSRAQVRRHVTQGAVTQPRIQTARLHAEAKPQANTTLDVQRNRATSDAPKVSRTQVRQTLTAKPQARNSVQQVSVKREAPAASAGTGKAAGAVAAASTLTGIPYVWGQASRSATDCSGFVMMAYAAVGIQLPHQSEAMHAYVTPTSNPQPGDLIFWPGHVAIYAGNGMMYEAQHPGVLSGLYPVRPGGWYGHVKGA